MGLTMRGRGRGGGTLDSSLRSGERRVNSFLCYRSLEAECVNTWPSY